MELTIPSQAEVVKILHFRSALAWKGSLSRDAARFRKGLLQDHCRLEEDFLVTWQFCLQICFWEALWKVFQDYIDCGMFHIHILWIKKCPWTTDFFKTSLVILHLLLALLEFHDVFMVKLTLSPTHSTVLCNGHIAAKSYFFHTVRQQSAYLCSSLIALWKEWEALMCIWRTKTKKTFLKLLGGVF